MTKWTKGPYTFEQCMRFDGTTVQEWFIQVPVAGDSDEPTIIASVHTSKRDAALLAAAPDVAEALESVMAELKEAMHTTYGAALADMQTAYAEGRAALAKARGEA